MHKYYALLFVQKPQRLFVLYIMHNVIFTGRKINRQNLFKFLFAVKIKIIIIY